MKKTKVSQSSDYNWRDFIDVSCATFIAENYVNPHEGFCRLDHSINTPPKHVRDLAGYVSLKLGDQEILGPDLWTLVEYFWAYFAQSLEEYALTGTTNIPFPDQPLKLTITRIENQLARVVMQTDQPRSSVCNESHLICTLCDEAVRALKIFASMQRINDSNALIEQLCTARDKILEH